MTIEQLEAERAAFNEWITSLRLSTELNEDGNYSDLSVSHRWDAWLVRTMRKEPPPHDCRPNVIGKCATCGRWFHSGQFA